MSPNVPVPPPPPPPGGVPGFAGARDDAQHTVTYPPAPSLQQGPPPSYAPTSGPTSQQAPAPRATPADGQPTVVAPVAAFQAATVQHVTPVTQLPTAAQPAVPAPSATAHPAPPQRVRYATEQNGFTTAAPVGSAASRPAYAAEHAPNGYAAPAASYPGQAPATQPAYHPPAAVATPPAARASQDAGGGSGTPRPPAGRGGGGERRGGRGSDRLSPGWIAFIVVDVLLVIGAVVFAISLIGGGDEDPEAQGTTPPAATATDGTGETPDAEPTVSETFASESRNITCEVTDVGVTCEIAQLATQPAPVAGCDGTQGYRAVLDDSGVTTPCVPAAEQPGPAAESVAILPYGESKTVGGYTCDSAETGMTCRDDATGQGFTIARAGIRPL